MSRFIAVDRDTAYLLPPSVMNGSRRVTGRALLSR